MPAIWTLAAKDLRLLLRDRVGFFFMFVFPLLYAIFFGALFSGMSKRGPSAIPVAVVDEDHTAAAAEYISRLKSDPSLAVTLVENRAVAETLVRRGQRSAYVAVTTGFGPASQRLFWGPPMRLEIGTDPGQSMTAGLVQGLVTAHAFDQMKQLLAGGEAMRKRVRQALDDVRSGEGLTPLQRAVLESLLTSVEAVYETFPSDLQGGVSQPSAGGWQPLEVVTTTVTRSAAHTPRLPTSSFAICFPQGIVWGVMACAAGFASSLLVERTRGTLPRLMVAPLARWQILAGKATACFAATAALMVVLLLVARLPLFDVRPTALSLLVAAIVSVACAIVGLMMVLSALGKSEAAVSGISWAVIIVAAMLGGGMLPLAFMPRWMQTISHISPVKWAILALEGATWRGFSPAELAAPCAVLVSLGLLGLLIGASAFRRGDQR